MHNKSKLKYTCEFLATPISSPGCEYAYGIYPESHECSTYYIKCAGGEPHQSSCEPGLAYDDRIHGCNWPDKLLEICNPEGRLFCVCSYLPCTVSPNINTILMNLLNVFVSAVVGFSCPAKVDPHSAAARFWPFPRFAVPGDRHRLITCVEGHPRLISCGDEQIFNEDSLSCEEYK